MQPFIVFTPLFISFFLFFRNPTYEQILGIHFEKATTGQFKYLNLNTTFNSTIMYNYRQTESAFWWAYLPYVIGTYVPTYPPTTEVCFMVIILAPPPSVLFYRKCIFNLSNFCNPGSVCTIHKKRKKIIREYFRAERLLFFCKKTNYKQTFCIVVIPIKFKY